MVTKKRQHVAQQVSVKYSEEKSLFGEGSY